jgi:hypothetical protein
MRMPGCSNAGAAVGRVAGHAWTNLATLSTLCLSKRLSQVHATFSGAMATALTAGSSHRHRRWRKSNLTGIMFGNVNYDMNPRARLKASHPLRSIYRCQLCSWRRSPRDRLEQLCRRCNYLPAYLVDLRLSLSLDVQQRADARLLNGTHRRCHDVAGLSDVAWSVASRAVGDRKAARLTPAHAWPVVAAMIVREVKTVPVLGALRSQRFTSNRRAPPFFYIGAP